MTKNLLFTKLNSCKRSILVFLFTILICLGAFAQNRQITGKVTAADDGTPLPGVTVKVKGTATGTVTDVAGNFRLSAPANATLVFSYIGYITQQVVAGSSGVINVKLTPAPSALNEVVVIGYGTAKRSDVNGAISSVSASTIESMPVTSPDQALQGRAAGVQVTNNDGSPGGNITVLIRGTGSLASNGNVPLYVVDGYPLDAGGINNINPSDIASIDILKDAASTAIYGIRAANGVVLITTKRGKKNGVQVSADAYNQIQSKPKEYKVLNADQFATLANQEAAIPGSDFATFSGWTNPASLHNIDWQNAVYGNGLTQNYDVAIRGGNDKIQATASLAYYNQDGTVLDSYFHRATVSTGVDAEPAKWLKTSTNVKYTYQQGNNPFGTGSLIQLTQLPPTLDGGNKLTNQVKDAQGNYGFFNPIYTDVLSYTNPVYSIETNRNYPSNNFVLANTSLEVTLLPGLKIKTNGGVNANFSSDIYDQPADLRENEQYGGSARTGIGYYSQNTSQTSDWLLENTLSYDKTFGKHTINFVGGFSGQKTIWTGMGGSGVPPNNTIQDLSQVEAGTLQLNANNPVGSNTGNGQNITTLASEFARLNYTFDDRYILTGIIRRDGSSKFDSQNQYGTFPSGAFTWKAKKESFLKDVSWLNDLKLRATYGETGNQGAINPFQYQALFVGNRPATFNPGGIGTQDDNLGYPFDKVYQNGYAAEQPANAGLKWETDTQADGGIDISFLNGDLDVTADYYDRKSKNFLLNLEVPAESGFQYLTENVGSMDNRGLELTIDYHHNVSKDLRFGALLTFSTLDNKLTSITSGTNEVSNFGGLALSGAGWNPFSETFIGQPVGEFWGYKSLGIFQSQAQIDALNAKAQLKGYQYYYSSVDAPGDRYFADVNNLGAVTSADETSLGSPIPKFYGGLNLTTSYKGWDFIAYFYGVYGNKIYNYEESSLETFQNRGFVGIENISEQYFQNAWTPQNHSNTYAAITTNDNVSLNSVASSAYIENGSFLKLKNFTVGYTLPQDLVKRIGVSKVRVYLSSQNLFTITGYKGLDPEVGSQGGNATQNGIDNGIYPSSRYFTVGINATF